MSAADRNPVVSLFGRRVARERMARGWSQVTLAHRAGVSRAGLCWYETGRREPGVTQALAIADALGIPLDDLLAVPVCVACDGHPRPGWPCAKCGRAAPAADALAGAAGELVAAL